DGRCDWPSSGEIDIMEQMCNGDPATWNTTLTTLHWNSAGRDSGFDFGNQWNHAMYSGSCNVGEQLGNKWRIYGVEWTPTLIIGYYSDSSDGNCGPGNRVEYYRAAIGSGAGAGLDSFADFNFFFLFNYAVGGSYVGGAVDGNFGTREMLVDWVRVYQDKSTYPGSYVTNGSNLTPENQGMTGGGGGGNTTNYAISTSNVTSLANGKTHNFTVNYTSPAAADIWVSLYRTGDYNLVAEKKLQVAAASSSTSKTISLTIGSDVPAGNDYILLFDIRPRDADWQQRKATKEFKFISITSSLTWSISTNHVTSLDNNKTHTFSVNYSAPQTADMWVTLYKGNDYALISENKISNIATGTGTKNITLNVPGSVAAGNDYIVFFDIRPAGSDWQQRAASQEDKNVTIKNTVAQATIPAAPERKHYDKEKLCYVKGTTYNNFNYVLDWGQSATASKEANSKSIKLAFNSGNVGHYLGSCFGDYAVLNITETPYLHFHVYTDGTSMTSFDWYCISQGPAENKKNVALTKGQWKEYTIDVRTLSGVDLSKFFQFKWCCKDDRGVDGNVYIDNIFFSGSNVPTSVADVASDAVSVYAAEGAVVVAGAQDQRARVVDLTGRTVIDVILTSDHEQIPMGKGLCIVLVGDKAHKVLVR
ncbi:MAG: hypothetical protein J5808_01775, partial [Paludibacteraceae bacterium]|nr:hypothetical protein [Paludibacteraceae bacterium]